jgi:hypothetical protein
MIKILVMCASQGPDYLQDLIFHGLAQHRNIALFCNLFPPHLAVDFPKSIPVYGNGYTAFRRLGPSYNAWKDKVITADNELQKVDICIYLNVQRYFNVQEAKLLKLRGATLMAVDGEDNCSIQTDALDICDLYYKRELKHPADKVAPISFKIPQDNIVDLIPFASKISFLAPCDPRNRSSYLFTSEASYYGQYTSSCFGVTMKKGGWDCMRHYEIIAAGAIPFFINICNKPLLTMSDYPAELQKKANRLSEQMFASTKMLSSWEEEYMGLLNCFRDWLTLHGTTEAYAKIFISDFVKLNK